MIFFCSNLKAECVLKVRVNDAPPQYMLKDGSWTGKAVELIDVLLEEANCTADYQKRPWQRGLLELEKGTIDAMVNVVYNKERAQNFYFIWPNISNITVLLVRKDSNFEISSLNDLKDLPAKVGYENGNLFDQVFINKFESDEVFRNIFSASPVGNMTEMVYRRRLSGELTLLENAEYSIKTNPKYAKDMKIHSFQISNLPTFFAFSKRSISKDMFLKLNEANIRAVAKGAYENVKKKWEQ